MTSQITETAQVELIPLDLANLRKLAAEKAADLLAPEGALPPSHVAKRALLQLEDGIAACWCVPYLISLRDSGEIVGGCTFKGKPSNGCVEIGYGVAQSARCRGIATAAVAHLVQLAASSGVVRRIEAHILPGNIASARVVSRIGFEPRQTIVDPDGEQVVLWAYQIAT